MSKKKDSLKPWLSRPAINRSVTLPLTRPLTQRLSNLNEFHPNELDPYLLFDARDSMIGTLENPTLDLDPSKPDTLNVITATRAGVATYTDADGLIQSADPDTVRVDHVQGEELTPTKFQRVPYSTPDSNWATVNSTLVEDFGVAPDNTQSASKVTKLAVSGSGSSNDRVEYPSIAITNGTTYSVSVHLKNIDVVGFTTITARVSGGSLFRVKFIWDTSALNSESGTTSNRLVEDVGNGWYRVSFSFDANGSAVDFEIDVDRSTEGREDNSSILVWGAQLEEGTTASDFVANTTGSPKFITGATYGPRVPMILVEPSSENLVDYSEDFSSWTPSNTTVTLNDTESPDGNTTASRITASSQTARKSISRYAATTNTIDYTISFYAKAGSHQFVQTYVANNGAIYANFDLVSGQTQAFGGTTSKMTLVANGFYRCEFTYTGASGLAAGYIIFADSLTHARAGDSSADGYYYIWGAQVETGSVATSYIPTSGSTVTRAADDLVISGSDFSDFFNGSEGTFFVTARIRDTYPSYPLLWGGGLARFMYSNVGTSYVYAYDGANSVSFGSPNENADSNLALSYSSSASEMESSRDGVYGNTNSYNGNFSTAPYVYIGSGFATTFNGHFRRILYWPYHSDRL